MIQQLLGAAFPLLYVVLIELLGFKENGIEEYDSHHQKHDDCHKMRQDILPKIYIHSGPVLMRHQYQ